MKILLTAFEPFGGERVNSACLALELLPERLGDIELARTVLPTAFDLSGEVLLRAMDRERPDAVLCLGQAAGRRCLTPERVAINLDDARIPDNLGAKPEDRPIVPGGPAAYFSTLPIRKMVRAMAKAGVPAEISNSAGTFVCNHVMYVLLHALDRDKSRVRGGFMHIPLSREQGEGRGIPWVETADAARGIAAAVTAAADRGDEPGTI